MKTKNIKNQIKEFFFLTPTIKLRVRQIERELKLPLPSVIRYTKELEKENILKIEKISNITLYSADRTSISYLLEKRLFNIKQLYTLKLIKHLIEEYNNPTIVLFGSYSKGEDIENSDIDIYIETPIKVKDLSQFEKILKRNIQIFQHKNIKEITNKNLINNIINGVTLNKFLEVIK